MVKDYYAKAVGEFTRLSTKFKPNKKMLKKLESLQKGYKKAIEKTNRLGKKFDEQNIKAIKKAKNLELEFEKRNAERLERLKCM